MVAYHIIDDANEHKVKSRMNEVKLPSFEAIESELKTHGFSVSPSELHGLLTGMISGGLNVEDDNWLGPVADYANEGKPLLDGAKGVVRTVFDAATVELSGMAHTVFTSTASELTNSIFSFTLLIPDENSDLVERAESLTEWASSFISGLGLMGLDKTQFSAEVNEVLAELQEISLLGIDEDEDLTEQAEFFEQVLEHVPMCVLTCLVELGERPSSVELPTVAGTPEDIAQKEKDDKPTLH